MTKEVSCHKGKCVELKKGRSASFADLFEADSVVTEIERDLWVNNMYGK